jgi:acyl carrier protein
MTTKMIHLQKKRLMPSGRLNRNKIIQCGYNKITNIMNTDTSKAEQLRIFISELTFTDIDKIKKDTLIFEEGLFDSLGFLSLVGYLQDEFGIEVDGDELNEENFESIKAIVAFVKRKKKHQNV